MRASPRRRSPFHSWFSTHDARTARRPSTTFVNIGCCCSCWCWCSHHHNNLIYVNFRISSNQPHHLPFSARPSSQPSSLRACTVCVPWAVASASPIDTRYNLTRSQTVEGAFFFTPGCSWTSSPSAVTLGWHLGGNVRGSVRKRQGGGG